MLRTKSKVWCGVVAGRKSVRARPSSGPLHDTRLGLGSFIPWLSDRMGIFGFDGSAWAEPGLVTPRLCRIDGQARTKLIRIEHKKK